MSSLISSMEFKKLERFIRSFTEKIFLKNYIYRFLIIPNQELKLKKLREIVNQSPELKHPKLKKTNDTKKIIFHALDARHMTHTYLESAISKSLQIRGHETKMIICDKALSMCTTFHRIDHPPNDWSCNNCSNFSKEFYKTVGLDYGVYSDYYESNKILEKIDRLSIEKCKKFIYKDIKVGDHAETSTDRYFKGFISSQKLYDKILRLELANAIIATDVAENVLEKEKPDILVTSHGCYSSWGSFADIFNKKGIRMCVWASGEGNTVTFDKDKSDEYFNKYFKKIRNKKDLDDFEKKELNNFLKRRIKGEEGQVELYDFADTKKEKLEKIFNFKNYEKTFVLFPNVPWDAALVGADTIFNNVYEWISKTIDLFKNKPKYLQIIKIHPSEKKVMESQKSMHDYIKENFPDLDKNIKIIPSDTTISPYSLFPFIDIGIVYVGTIGLEMAINNIPVISAGNAHYANKGFTYDPSNKKQYQNLLFKDLKPIKKQQDLAKIYGYFHFIKKFVPRSFIYVNNFLDQGWNINKLEDFKSGKNPYLDHICNYILHNGIYQNW